LALKEGFFPSTAGDCDLVPSHLPILIEHEQYTRRGINISFVTIGKVVAVSLLISSSIK
jgi:hypothetical protein